jgi:copper chaperone
LKNSILVVDGMSCEHCVKAVETAVGALAGVSSVTVDLKTRTVAVEHDTTLAIETIKDAIEDQGYDVIG